jgi:hypothetical protein
LRKEESKQRRNELQASSLSFCSKQKVSKEETQYKLPRFHSTQNKKQAKKKRASLCRLFHERGQKTQKALQNRMRVLKISTAIPSRAYSAESSRI